MDWTTEQQTRFDALRTRELAGTLTDQEQLELDEFVAQLEAEEERYLAPAIAQMRAEQVALRTQLESLQTENEALGRLLAQQEQLAADTRHWLVQFEQRHLQIKQTYTRLTGSVLAFKGTQ